MEKNNVLPEQIRAFKANASKIKTNTLIPICGYILLEFLEHGATLTKNNLRAFVVKKVDGNGTGSFLIDERILLGFVDAIPADSTDVMTVENGDKCVILKCGKLKVKSHTDDSRLFPVSLLPDQAGTTLSQSTLDELVTASKFTNEAKEIASKIDFVFVGKGYITASDGFLIYFSKTDHPIQSILRKEVIQGIASIGECQQSENDSYDFFTTNTVMLGFVKPEIGFFDMTSYAAFPREKVFEVNKKELLSFTKQVLSSSVNNQYIGGSWVPGPQLTLISKEENYSLSIERTIDVVATGTQFNFTVSFLQKLLLAVPGDEIIVYKVSEEKYYISDPASTYLSFIIGVVPDKK